MNESLDAVRRRLDTSKDPNVGSVIDQLDEPARSALVSRLRPRRFGRGQIVYAEGERSDCLQVGVRLGVLAVARGSVQVLDRAAVERLAGRTR